MRQKKEYNVIVTTNSMSKQCIQNYAKYIIECYKKDCEDKALASLKTGST